MLAARMPAQVALLTKGLAAARVLARVGALARVHELVAGEVALPTKGLAAARMLARVGALARVHELVAGE